MEENGINFDVEELIDQIHFIYILSFERHLCPLFVQFFISLHDAPCNCRGLKTW